MKKMKNDPKQKALAQRLDAGRGNSATAAPSVQSTINSRGIKFKVGDRVVVRGGAGSEVIGSFQSPLAAVLATMEGSTVVHVDVLSHYVAPPAKATADPSAPPRTPQPAAARPPVRMDDEEEAGDGPPPAGKPERKVGRPWVQADGPFSVVHIASGTAADYLMESVAADLFRLTKLKARAAVTYTVQIGRTRSCGCDGFRSYKHCKHVEALEALRASKRI